STPPRSAAPPRPRPSRPAAPPPAPVAEPAFVDDEVAEEEPVVSRERSKKKQKKTNPMPLIIGGGAVVGVGLIGLIIWVVMKPGPKGGRQSEGIQASAPSGSAVPP